MIPANKRLLVSFSLGRLHSTSLSHSTGLITFFPFDFHLSPGRIEAVFITSSCYSIVVARCLYTIYILYTHIYRVPIPNFFLFRVYVSHESRSMIEQKRTYFLHVVRLYRSRHLSLPPLTIILTVRRAEVCKLLNCNCANYNGEICCVRSMVRYDARQTTDEQLRNYVFLSFLMKTAYVSHHCRNNNYFGQAAASKCSPLTKAHFRCTAVGLVSSLATIFDVVTVPPNKTNQIKRNGKKERTQLDTNCIINIDTCLCAMCSVHNRACHKN